MFAALALAAAFVFQPFHPVAYARDIAGELHTVTPPKAFATRRACEAWLGDEVKRMEPAGNLVLTEDGPMEVLAMFCIAEGQPA